VLSISRYILNHVGGRRKQAITSALTCLHANSWACTRGQVHAHAHMQIHAPAHAGRSLAQSLTHNMLNVTSMTNVSSLSLSTNTSPSLFSSLPPRSMRYASICKSQPLYVPFSHSLTHSHSHSHSRSHSHSFSVSPSLTGILFRNGNLTLGPFGWVVMAPVGWVGVWGFWAGPGLVWMGCGIFAAELLWGGSLLAAGHQSSSTVSRCW